jgi:hypothetical protein
MKLKYPRTFHFPWSLGVCSDDKVIENDDCFQGEEVVVTEKMDGENTTVARDYTHSRSLDSSNHWSRTRVKALQASIGYMIPEGMRICGENLFAHHSIEYYSLPDYFLAFSVWNSDLCLDWDSTLNVLAELGLQSVPVLYRGPYTPELIKPLYTGISKCGGEQEGYVVRCTRSFKHSEFKQNVAKFVRANHVTASDHWMHQAAKTNHLANGSLV